jgi:uncharacterized protein (TIGR00297 family)
VLVGAAVLWGVGPRGFALLAFFFVTSSVLTRLPGKGRGRDSDRGGRTASQVFANAGVATMVALAVRWFPDAQGAVAAFGGALAAATADTWASEIGEWRGGGTRLVTTWRRVDPGVDGGVSWPGTGAAVAASVAVAGLAAGLFGATAPVGPILAGGMVGMAVDSLAGATIEGRAPLVRNDAVNWLGTAAGAVSALVLG